MREREGEREDALPYDIMPRYIGVLEETLLYESHSPASQQQRVLSATRFGALKAGLRSSSGSSSQE